MHACSALYPQARGVDFSALENSIEDGLLLIDEQAKILAHNTQAAALMKAEGSDFTGQALSLWLKDSSGEQLQVFSDRQLGTSLNLGHEILSFTRLAREPRGLLLLVRHHNLEQDIRQDIARYHHSQYFAKIGTWDWQVGTDTLYCPMPSSASSVTSWGRSPLVMSSSTLGCIPRIETR